MLKIDRPTASFRSSIGCVGSKLSEASGDTGKSTLHPPTTQVAASKHVLIAFKAPQYFYLSTRRELNDEKLSHACYRSDESPDDYSVPPLLAEPRAPNSRTGGCELTEFLLDLDVEPASSDAQSSESPSSPADWFIDPPAPELSPGVVACSSKLERSRSSSNV